MPCTLSRTAGSPIASRVLDLGMGGMRIHSQRPLGVDESLSFNVQHGGECIQGRVRVVCQEYSTVYALRFERLCESDERLLKNLVSDLS
jgi:hypothetical protein